MAMVSVQLVASSVHVEASASDVVEPSVADAVESAAPTPEEPSPPGA